MPTIAASHKNAAQLVGNFCVAEARNAGQSMEANTPGRPVLIACRACCRASAVSGMAGSSACWKWKSWWAPLTSGSVLARLKGAAHSPEIAPRTFASFSHDSLLLLESSVWRQLQAGRGHRRNSPTHERRILQPTYRARLSRPPSPSQLESSWIPAASKCSAGASRASFRVQALLQCCTAAQPQDCEESELYQADASMILARSTRASRAGVGLAHQRGIECSVICWVQRYLSMDAADKYRNVPLYS